MRWHYLLLFCWIWLIDISDTTSCSRHYHSITSIESVGSTSFCGWTAGRCHVAYSTGITYPNLPVMKNPTRGKKEERDQDYGITNGECYKTRWKMGILILDRFAPSSRDLQKPDARGLRRALCSICMWASEQILTLLEKCISECLSSCCRAHTISPLQNKQRMWWSKGF